MRDYTSKTVYVGIDVHKNTYALTAVCDKCVIKKDTLKADPMALVAYCKNKFQGAKLYTAYEAGFCGFSLHRILVSMGIDNLVVHPAGIETVAKDRVKNDRRDSAKISIQLAEGRLRGIYVPTVERETHREITRVRETFMRKRTRAATQIKSFLHRQGLFQGKDETVFCKQKTEKLLKKAQENESLYALRLLCQEWLYLHDQIKDIDEKLAEQAQEDPLEKTYRSLPGVGRVTARVLANELGDLLQFANEKQLFSYVGLTPQEHSSGEHRWLGHISRQGKSIIRKVLVQSAWTAIRCDKGLEKRFTELSKRAGSRRAIVAIARIMIGYARCCFRENRLYEERI